MQVLQNGLRFGSHSGPQKFPKFLFLSYNIYKLIYNVSHSFLSLFNVKRLVSGKKVCFQPIVDCCNGWIGDGKFGLTKLLQILVVEALNNLHLVASLNALRIWGCWSSIIIRNSKVNGACSEGNFSINFSLFNQKCWLPYFPPWDLFLNLSNLYEKEHSTILCIKII